MLFCCLWRALRLLVINISSSSPAINKLRRLLPAISVTTCGTVVLRQRVDNTWLVAALTARNEATRQAQNRDFCLPHLHLTPPLGYCCRNIAMPFGAEKLEWLGYQTVKIV